MWTPKQLLDPHVVEALRQSELFPEELIEFLGWNSGRANILNRSANCVKAAVTMLRDDEDNATTHEWLEKFYEKKRESVRPKVETTMNHALAIAGKIKNLTSRGLREDGDHELFADSYEQALLDYE